MIDFPGKGNKVAISTPFIKLDSFLKLSGACDTGGEAKMAVQQGLAKVNGEGCIQRGRKLVPGDEVELNGRQYEVVAG